MWECDFSALLSDGALLSVTVISGRGGRGFCGSGWCTVPSRRKSCCPGGASCCGRWEVRRWGNGQQGWDMTDLMTDSFRWTKMQLRLELSPALEPQARIHVRAWLWTGCMYVMHAVGVYSVYTKYDDPMMSLHKICQIPKCQKEWLSDPPTVRETFVNSVPSPEKISFCTNKIDFNDRLNLVPRLRIGDCFEIHFRHWGHCDLQL